MAGTCGKGWTRTKLSHSKCSSCRGAAKQLKLRVWAALKDPRSAREIRGQSREEQCLGTVSQQLCTGHQSPACSQGGHQTTPPARSSRLRALLLFRLTHWEGVCKTVCFTQVDTLRIQDLRDRELTAARQESVPVWLLAEGKEILAQKLKLAWLCLGTSRGEGGREEVRDYMVPWERKVQEFWVKDQELCLSWKLWNWVC